MEVFTLVEVVRSIRNLRIFDLLPILSKILRFALRSNRYLLDFGLSNLYPI